LARARLVVGDSGQAEELAHEAIQSGQPGRRNPERARSGAVSHSHSVVSTELDTNVFNNLGHGRAQGHDPPEKIGGLRKLSNVNTWPETLLTSDNCSQPMAGGKNQKLSSTTSGIDRDCGEKLAHVVIAAQKLHKFHHFLYASPEPGFTPRRQYVHDFGSTVSVTLRPALE
jgi:hypothetical protein